MAAPMTLSEENQVKVNSVIVHCHRRVRVSLPHSPKLGQIGPLLSNLPKKTSVLLKEKLKKVLKTSKKQTPKFVRKVFLIYHPLLLNGINLRMYDCTYTNWKALQDMSGN